MKTKKLRIIHLSDIHYSEKEKYKIDKYILNPLIQKLKKETSSIKADLLCITGDLIDKGGIDSENVETAFLSCYEDFISPIAEQLSINKENIIICPGNHDISKKEDSKRAEESLRSEFSSLEIVNNYIQEQSNNESPEDHHRIMPFKKFEKDFYKGVNNSNITLFSSAHKRTINGLKIGINCINSVWRYYDDDSTLFIGKTQLENEYVNDFSTCDLTIALSHNNPNSISKFESKYFENKLAENYRIHLFGHTHDCDMYLKAKFDNEEFFVINSRSLSYFNIDTDKYEYFNGFSIIDYDNELSEIEFFPIVYSNSRNEFSADTQLTGDSSYSIKRKLIGSNSDLKDMHEVSSYINKSIVLKMDELMLANGTDTIAPQSFEELFVEPTITFHNDEDKIVEISDLLTNDDSYIIQGQKESGKTVLLNYFVKYYINIIHKEKRIPILIDGKEKINNLKTTIAHTLGLMPSKIDNILQQYKCVLIIDNFDFKNAILSKQIVDLKNKYQDIKLLFSITITSIGEIPIELVNNNCYSLMTLLDLKSFSHTQIRLLADKWFKQNNCLNDEKEEQVEKFLLAFELPRTPMCISMFLWILEKQTNYQPINQSTMLQNFIEQILNKHSFEHEFYNQFDYTNKERLLAAIAYLMYENNKNNPNYAIKYSDLISFTTEYLTNRQFNFNAKEIIDLFISSGLLISIDDNTTTWIRFRFNCFFTFFLMRNMEKTEFYDFVLKEENYLSFCDEINLYTGLKRDCINILDTIMSRMDSMFEKLNTVISQQDLLYDSFFETSISLPDQINSKDIKKLKEPNSENRIKFEKMQDSLLQSSEINSNIERKDFNISPFDKMFLSINLGLNVLRNTEEVDIKNYKQDIFARIMKNVLAFACLNKVLFIHAIREEYKDMDETKKKEIENFISFLPLIISELLENSLATNKLTGVFENHLEEILYDKDISQMEKFLIVFVNLDSKGKNSKKFLSNFIKQIQFAYIKNCSFFKLLIYHIKAKGEKERNEYIDSLVTLWEKKSIVPKGHRFNKSEAKRQLKNEAFLRELAEEMKNV